MKFLLAYRTTPQASTSVTPACPMFGRELKTKLPELRSEKTFWTRMFETVTGTTNSLPKHMQIADVKPC